MDEASKDISECVFRRAAVVCCLWEVSIAALVMIWLLFEICFLFWIYQALFPSEFRYIPANWTLVANEVRQVGEQRQLLQNEKGGEYPICKAVGAHVAYWTHSNFAEPQENPLRIRSKTRLS